MGSVIQTNDEKNRPSDPDEFLASSDSKNDDNSTITESTKDGNATRKKATKGNKEPTGLKVIKTTLKDFLEALEYRNYRLSDRVNSFTEVNKKNIDSWEKKRNTEMTNNEFRSTDPIQFLDF